MKLSSFLVPAALASVALAQESASGPLPTELPGAEIIDIIPLGADEYPIGISNGTAYYIYVVNTTSLATEEADASTTVEKRAPRWIWWKPFPGEPAWKKRDAMPEAEANAEAEAAPRWIWWKPFPGEPAWKKRDAMPEAEANAEAEAAPRWIWWKPFPGEPAWKKRDAIAEAEAEASPRWIWWKPFPGEPAWKKRDAMPEAEAAPRWIWWKPFPGEPAW